MIYKYYGPPGTGKTYRLISRAKAYIRIGTPLDKIGYFAFTKKAALEAKKRMPAEDKKLPYFQTLHSFAYHQLTLNEEDVMQPFHYEELGKLLNVKVKYYDKYNKDEVIAEYENYLLKNKRLPTWKEVKNFGFASRSVCKRVFGSSRKDVILQKLS